MKNYTKTVKLFSENFEEIEEKLNTDLGDILGNCWETPKKF